MRLILQRVTSAAVRVGGETVGEIGRGVLVLAGVEQGDGERQVAAAADKLAGLRLFADAAGKMNLDAAAAGAAFLVVSQFTLAADLAGRGFTVAGGRFGAHMEVELVNDGPVTFVLDL